MLKKMNSQRLMHIFPCSLVIFFKASEEIIEMNMELNTMC